MQKSWLIDLFLLTIFVGIAFAFLLGSRPLNVPDEGRYCEIAREMLASHNFITPHINGIKYFEKPPLFYWMQAGGLKLFGLSEWACRFITALMGLLGVLATYFTARKLFDRKTGLYSAIILASSLLYFSLARVITLDMTVSVFLTLSLFSFILGVYSSRKYYYFLYIFSGLAVLTKGLIGVIFPGSIIFIWLLFTNNWRFLKDCYIFRGSLIFLAITLPWHILVQLKNPEFFHYYFIVQQFARYFTLEQHRYQPDWYYIPIVLLGVFPWTGFLYGVIKSIKLSDHKALYFLISFLVIFIFFSLSKSKLVPYILPCFPFLAILIAKYFDASPRVGYIAIAVICVALAIAIPIYLEPSVTTNYTVAKHWAYGLMFILVANAVIIILVQRFFVQVIFSVLFLFTLCATIPYIYMDSIKLMAQDIKPPYDRVATYDYYYQDLPFYLNHDITIVNWKGELEFGSHYNNNINLMMDDKTFWEHWNSSEIIYLMLPKNIFKNIVIKNYYIISQEKNDILISNHEVQK